MEKLLTLKEVAEMLGCTDSKGRYIRELKKKGIIEGAKFGNKWLFKESSIENFIEHQFEIQNRKVFTK